MIRRVLPAVTGLVVGIVLAVAVLAPGRVGLDAALGTPFVQLAALTPLLLVAITASVFVGRMLALLVSARRRRGRPADERWPRLWAFGFAAMVGAAVVALVTAGLVGTRLLADEAPAAPPGAPELTVLSLNVEDGGADVAAVAALVRERAPDLVVLPEAGDAYRARLAPLLPGWRGWSGTPVAGDGDVASTTLLAGPRVPDLGVTSVPGTLFPAVEARSSSGGLRVVAVHAAAPVPGQVPQHAADMALLGRWCGAEPGVPTIVAGDLNATLDMSGLRAGAAGCTDALSSVGSGTAGTWPSSWPRWFGLQIDHVLVGGGVGVREAVVLDVPGTDHRAVLARLVVPAGMVAPAGSAAPAGAAR